MHWGQALDRILDPLERLPRFCAHLKNFVMGSDPIKQCVYETEVCLTVAPFYGLFSFLYSV